MFRTRTTLGTLLMMSAATAGFACSSNGRSSVDSANGSAAPSPPSAAPATSASPASSLPSATDTAKGANANFSDANILAKANAGDSTEVAVAKYMASNTSNAGVKAYANLLERDHAKGISSVEATAKKLNLTLQLPAGDTTVQAAAHALDHLKSLSGADRDSAFINHEIEDHKHDIDEAKQMADKAQAAEVKSLLRKEIPELQKHLDRAEALKRSGR